MIYDKRHIDLADLLRSTRQERNLTQEQVAKRLHWSRQRISNIESGQRRLLFFEVMDLADLYSIPVATLTEYCGGKR